MHTVDGGWREGEEEFGGDPCCSVKPECVRMMLEDTVEWRMLTTDTTRKHVSNLVGKVAVATYSVAELDRDIRRWERSGRYKSGCIERIGCL